MYGRRRPGGVEGGRVGRCTSVTASRMTDAYGAGTRKGCNAAECAVLSDGSDESDASDALPKLIGSHSTPASERMPAP